MTPLELNELLKQCAPSRLDGLLQLQFKATYVAMSWVKEAWTNSNGMFRVVAADGTFTKNGYFSNTILLLVGYDGQGRLVVLAFAVVSGETSATWHWFIRRVTHHFPGMEVLLADYDKGIQSANFQDHLRAGNIWFFRCV